MEIKKYSLEKLISLDSCRSGDFNYYCKANIDNILNPNVSPTGEIKYKSRILYPDLHKILACSHPFWYNDLFYAGQLISVNDIIYQMGIYLVEEKSFLVDFNPKNGGHLALKPI